jgi:hypothetical protein
MERGIANWDPLPSRLSDGDEARRSAGLRSSRLSAGYRETADAHPATHEGARHSGTAGGFLPLVRQLGRYRLRSAIGVTSATYDSLVPVLQRPVRELSRSPGGEVRSR